jgi:hypothetical protein
LELLAAPLSATAGNPERDVEGTHGRTAEIAERHTPCRTN